MRQPSPPGGVSQGVEPVACDTDRLEMVVHGNEPAAWQAKGFQSDVVGIRAPSGGQDELVYLDGLTVKSCGDGPARRGASYRRQLCLKVTAQDDQLVDDLGEPVDLGYTSIELGARSG